MWDPSWDQVFTAQEWGKYPGEELIRFIARTFYKAPERSAVRILEVGSGTGANLWFLAREGFHAVGLDGSAVAVEQATRRLGAEGLTVELHVGDAMDQPFPDNSFDAVLDVECLSANSRADAGRMLDEMYRVLKPGGWLYSKTFATGMTGEDSGVLVEGTASTYREMKDGPIPITFGLLRLTAGDDIPDLYGRFEDLQWDRLERTLGNRAKTIGEWVIVGRKPLA